MNRRDLITLFGGAAALLPVFSAFKVLLDPLRGRTATNGIAVKIIPLDALPADGIPRKFPVVAAKTDAWNKFQNVPIGAIYLRRTGEGRLEALNVVCPHAGCFVDFSHASNKFACPCHNSSFKLDGTIADTKSPSPRALDSLAVEVRPDGAIWVTFQNFQAGRPDKVPVA